MKNKRFKLTILTGIFFMIVTQQAIYNNMEQLAIACIGTGLLGLLGFLWVETKRKSE